MLLAPMDIVTGIPDLIERVVHCARLIKDASNMERNVDFDLQHGRHVAHQLILMGDIIKRTKYLPATEKQIADALSRAEESTVELVKKLSEVRDKAGIENGAGALLTETMTPSSVSCQETLSEKVSHVDRDANLLPSGRSWCGCFSFGKLSMKRFLVWIGRRSKIKAPVQKAVVGAITRVQYLALIERDIKAALNRMDKAHMDLFHLMFIAPIHSRVVGDEAAQEFIRNAQERLKDERPIERIDIPRDWLKPVDDRLRANEFEVERPYTLYTIADGPYAGCLVDRRDIRHLRCQGLGETAQDDTNRLARLLRRETTSKDGRTDEKIAVLRCRGVSFPNKDLHDLVFQLPPGFGTPKTLRRVLLDGNSVNHMRDARLELAIQLCTAVHVLHSLNIVHKGVRPDNIILLPPLQGTPNDNTDKAYDSTLGKPYLAGFCYSRSDNSQSGMDRPYEAIFADIIYHHPRHLERWRNYEFDRADDIYSLGICLLEIGLWRSLLHWSEEEDWYVVGEDWQLQGPQYTGPDGYNAPDAWYRRRGLFIKLAKDCLPVTMTSTYAEVVQSCLEFREKENERMHADAEVSHEFVEEVMTKLLSMRY